MSFIPPFSSKKLLINPFLNSRISTEHDKVEGHLANGEIIIKGIETLLWNLSCFDLVKYSLAEIWMSFRNMLIMVIENRYFKQN